MRRASRVDASLQQAPDVVRMATCNGADALGHETGRLAPGRKADVILVNLQSQMFTPLVRGNADQLFSHLVFAANGSCVDTTIIDGKIVIEDVTGAQDRHSEEEISRPPATADTRMPSSALAAAWRSAAARPRRRRDGRSRDHTSPAPPAAGLGRDAGPGGRYTGRSYRTGSFSTVSCTLRPRRVPAWE